jgi:plasmid stabilization system protein ParE
MANDGQSVFDLSPAEKLQEEYRRGLVRRFPYAVFYEHTEQRVVVYAILHTARDPLRWGERLT